MAQFLGKKAAASQRLRFRPNLFHRYARTPRKSLGTLRRVDEAHGVVSRTGKSMLVILGDLVDALIASGGTHLYLVSNVGVGKR